jgi:hypothetical protein
VERRGDQSQIGNKTLRSDRGEHKEKYKLFLFLYRETTRKYSSAVNALPEYFRFRGELADLFLMLTASSVGFPLIH